MVLMKILEDNQLTILKLFCNEALQLKSACFTHLVSTVTDETGELYDAGTLLYNDIDPMVERGIVATARLFLSENETIFIGRVANMALRFYRDDALKIKEIREFKKAIEKVRAESRDVFDRYWNVTHLHLDINDNRYEEQHNIFASCRGPLQYAYLLKTIEEISDLASNLSRQVIRPMLLESGRATHSGQYFY